jgi:hypothetical protein
MTIYSDYYSDIYSLNDSIYELSEHTYQPITYQPITYQPITYRPNYISVGTNTEPKSESFIKKLKNKIFKNRSKKNE